MASWNERDGSRRLHDSHGSVESSGIAPGKQTLTRGLQGQAPSRPIDVQRKPDPAQEAAREVQATNTEQWFDLAVRPDLPARSVQRRGAAQVPDASSTLRSHSGDGGQAIADDVRGRMERGFGTDFSAVRIHQGPEAAAMGALAYTQGTDIHFAPGQYQPASRDGQELLGHELAHVVQQAQGRVQPTKQAKGMGINDDAGLEREADAMGAAVARGDVVGAAPAAMPRQSRSQPLQRMKIRNDPKNAELSGDTRKKHIEPDKEEQRKKAVADLTHRTFVASASVITDAVDLHAHNFEDETKTRSQRVDIQATVPITLWNKAEGKGKGSPVQEPIEETTSCTIGVIKTGANRPEDEKLQVTHFQKPNDFT